MQCSAKVAKTWGQMSQQSCKLGDIFKISETLNFFLKIMFIRHVLHVVLDFTYSVVCS